MKIGLSFSYGDKIVYFDDKCTFFYMTEWNYPVLPRVGESIYSDVLPINPILKKMSANIYGVESADADFRFSEPHFWINVDDVHYESDENKEGSIIAYLHCSIETT